MMAWHVATVKQFSERVAENALGAKGFTAFLPKYYTERVSRGLRTWTERIYIPGYVFVRFDPVEDVLWPNINFVRGIRTLLYSAAEKPAPIRDIVMNVLIDRCNGDRVKAEELDVALSRVVPVGSMVRIEQGPLEGRVGKVVWSASDRVTAVLSVFGRATNVSLPSRSVELV